jgi:hypothetical protein
MSNEAFDNFCDHMYNEYRHEKSAYQETDIKSKEDYIKDNKSFLREKFKKEKR